MRVISQYVSTNLNAGPKAKVDVEKILNSKFNAKVYTLKMNGKEGKSQASRIFYLIKKVFFSLVYLKKNELTIIQCPFTNFLPLMNISKNKIAFIHDLEGLRSNNISVEKKEIAFLKTCKYIVCHNDKMKKYLVENGVDSNRIFILEIFDYLCELEKTENTHNNKIINLIYTGNLSKATFLNQLEEAKMNFKINVYGVGNDQFFNKKIRYKGKYLPDEIPSKIEGDLGLVWDGNYDDTLDSDGLKNYTKYNCPHKLSCYLAANVPVIVWDKSAMAEFVKKQNVGYTVSNLYDINNINLKDYNIKLKNAIKIGEKIRSGFYTKSVLNDILKIENRRR